MRFFEKTLWIKNYYLAGGAMVSTVGGASENMLSLVLLASAARAH